MTPVEGTRRETSACGATECGAAAMRACTALILVVGCLALVRAGEQARPRFTDVSAAAGLRIAEKTGVGGTNPHAVAVEDFDGDGLYDVIIPTFGKPHIYY